MRVRAHIAYKEPRFHVEETGRNVSGVVDKLIRLTAKLTECYASDIYYTINSLLEAMAKREAFYQILSFRECGVNVWSEPEAVSISEGVLQTWELKYVPGEQYDGEDKTTLTRVDIVEG